MYYMFFINMSVESHIHCIQFLAIMEKDAMNMLIKGPWVGWSIFWVFVLEEYGWIL